jgi:hypothetical protein
VNAWELDADGIYRRREPRPGEESFDIHAWLLNRYRLPADWALAGARTRGPQQVPLPAPA